MADQLSAKWQRNRSEVNRLRKADTVTQWPWRRSWGVVVNPDWRAAEIREVVKDALFPAGAEDDRRDLRNLGAKEKEELQVLAAKTGAEARAPGGDVREVAPQHPEGGNAEVRPTVHGGVRPAPGHNLRGGDDELPELRRLVLEAGSHRGLRAGAQALRGVDRRDEDIPGESRAAESRGQNLPKPGESPDQPLAAVFPAGQSNTWKHRSALRRERRPMTWNYMRFEPLAERQCKPQCPEKSTGYATWCRKPACGVQLKKAVTPSVENQQLVKSRLQPQQQF